MRKPRLIYENDARHHLLYRFAPPLSVHRLRQPVDELLGTSVDTLFYGFIAQQTQPFEAKAGLRWLWHPSERTQVMWWRAGENLKQSIAAGNDPLKIAVDRAHGHGIQVLTWLYWEPKNPASDDFSTYSDHADPEVRQRRLETIEEACQRYGLDGIGLNYYVPPIAFSAEVGRPTDAPNNPPALNRFFREVRALLDRLGEDRGQRLGLPARVHPDEAANSAAGLEVRQWLSEGLVDLVVPTLPHPNSPQDSALLDTNPALDGPSKPPAPAAPGCMRRWPTQSTMTGTIKLLSRCIAARRPITSPAAPTDSTWIACPGRTPPNSTRYSARWATRKSTRASPNTICSVPEPLIRGPMPRRANCP